MMNEGRSGDVDSAQFELLFAPGTRPACDRVRHSFPPAAADRSAVGGRVELVQSGLTFELCGPAPDVPATRDLPAATLGFGEGAGIDGTGLEAMTLQPSAHVRAGMAQIPVIRVAATLAMGLVLRFPVVAVLWRPARTLVEPRRFVASVGDWLAGGEFPAEVLVGMARQADGSLGSCGLALFIGHEIAFRGDGAEDHATLAVRHLIAQGVPDSRQTLHSGGATIVIEPRPASERIALWREPV